MHVVRASMIGLLTLVGCANEPPPPAAEAPLEPSVQPAPAAPESPPAAAPPGPQSDTPTSEQMAGHFAQVLEARDAVVRGDLVAARAAGAKLADTAPTTDMPDIWAPHVSALRLQARELADAPQLTSAAIAVGKLGVVCGTCHLEVGASPKLSDAPPVSGQDVEQHMLRHQWAADRLWEGLIASADERWSGGAGAMVEAPLHPSALLKERTVSPPIAAIAERVHGLATSAQAAQAPAERAQFYAELLVTCSECHAQLDSPPER